jgi:hypothetical protein
MFRPPFRPAGTAFGGGRSRRDAIGCGCVGSTCSNGRADRAKTRAALMLLGFPRAFWISLCNVVGLLCSLAT